MERVLETIVERSRPELEAAKKRVPASELRRRIADAPPVREFTGSLRKPGLRVIAELKAASPSKGVIRLPLEVELLAAELEAMNIPQPVPMFQVKYMPTEADLEKAFESGAALGRALLAGVAESTTK